MSRENLQGSDEEQSIAPRGLPPGTYFSNQAPPPKITTIFQNSSISWEPRAQHRSLWGKFTFETLKSPHMIKGLFKLENSQISKAACVLLFPKLLPF